MLFQIEHHTNIDKIILHIMCVYMTIINPEREVRNENIFPPEKGYSDIQIDSNKTKMQGQNTEYTGQRQGQTYRCV